jgi:hypothetical protein
MTRKTLLRSLIISGALGLVLAAAGLGQLIAQQKDAPILADHNLPKSMEGGSSTTVLAATTSVPVSPVLPIDSVLPSTNPAIDVTVPKPNTLVTFPLTIEGSITGAGWGVNEGEAGNAVVLDSAGNIISAPAIIMTTSDWLILPTRFKVTVGDEHTTSNIREANGFIRLNSRGEKDTDQVSAIAIPVRFH